MEACKIVFLSMSIPVMVSLISTTGVYTTASSCSYYNNINVTCVEEFLPRCVNVTSSGKCIQCRDSMFYGTQCENDCPQTCLDSRCQLINSRIVCTEGCVAGKKGETCEVDCPKSCTQCERYSDRCVGPCSRPNYYGDKCDKPCPSNCKEGCNRTGHCDSCMQGFRGSFCNVTCPKMCTQCEQYIIKCAYDCSNIGYYGDHCTQPCHDYCRDGCHRTTGECYSCKSGFKGRYCQNCEFGFRGENCTKTCQPNCKGVCDRDTGTCNSCESGFSGKYCETCDSGLWGRYCNETCSSYCKNGCDRDTGKCISCVEGFSGRYCETCEYGLRGANCTETCPSKCEAGCNRVTGVCVGCVMGYKGKYCDSCKTPDCEGRPISEEDTSTSKMILGLLIAVVVLVSFMVLAALTTLLYKRRKRLQRQKRSQTAQHPSSFSDQGDRTQYWATKYWEIDDNDLDSDPISSHRRMSDRPQYPLQDQQQRQVASQSSVKVTGPNPRQSNSARERCQKDPPQTGRRLPDVDFVLENQLYASADDGAACNADIDIVLRASAPSRWSGGFDMRDEERELECAAEPRSLCSVTSEDLRLTRKTESMLLWEQNTDFSKVYVKYITPDIDN